MHGNTVADGLAGAVMRKPLAIQKCDGRSKNEKKNHKQKQQIQEEQEKKIE